MSHFCIHVSLDDDASLLVDVIETCAFICDFVSIESIGRIYDIRQESDEDDGQAQDVFVQKIYDTIDRRSGKLEESYPFTYSKSGSNLEIKKKISDGGYTYLLCLFLTLASEKKICKTHINNHVRSLFEYACVVATAGRFDMNSVHFGHVESNSESFLERLKRVFEEMICTGKVRDRFIHGHSPYVKDGKIDVIAWKSSRAGDPVVFVQAASGANWTDKSIMCLSNYRGLSAWFFEPPSCQILVGIYIPFCIKEEYGGSVEERLHALAISFGSFGWRLEMASDVDKGVANGPRYHIDCLQSLQSIKKWVEQMKADLNNCS